jgi:hypothetical protein
MKNRRFAYLGAVIVLGHLGLLEMSCSSKGNEGEETGGSAGTDPAGGSGGSTGGGTGTGGAGGSTGGAGGSTGGVGGTSSECPDAITGNCNTTCAKSNAQCSAGGTDGTGDCDTVCGFNGIGQKHCICAGGIYSDCLCPRPASFMAANFAPYCDVLLSGTGMLAEYKDLPCDTEWQNCISRDAHTGTPRGCVCMTDPDQDGILAWSCGSTNKWFAPQP